MNIVIIGGGFAGVYAARTILKLFKNNPDVHITIVNSTNYFLFIPMLHEVATGSLAAANIAEPLREILHGKNFSFVRERALSVDFKKKKVKTETMALPYDYLVLATGSTVNFFNTPGAEHCLTLKNGDDAYALKNHLITSIEHSFYAQSEDKQMFATVVVVGAGPTGIELSLEIKEFIDQILKSNATNSIRPHVYLVHSGDVVLPQFPQLQKPAMKALQKHGIELLVKSRATRIFKNSVEMNNSVVIDAATIVWTAGVKPNTVATVPTIADERGCFVVDKYLQLQPHVFAVGDCASCVPEGHDKPLPMLAQIATKQGEHAALNLYLDYSGKQMRPFVPAMNGILLSLGRRKGAGVVFGLPIRGFIAWWFMRTIYLFKIIGTVNKLKTAYEWTLDLFVKRDTTEV
ncbi:MAG TPA: NAD(P)/FAD-dependent oxidoreductase [Candidatus Nanoarchaeia archaeon]|nr:NAD(P)/FAD-dependent oxidoreductase [Candidatus Nanoarchaeia archaeon]